MSETLAGHVIIGIFGVITASIAAASAYWARRSSGNSAATYLVVNSRMDELLAAARGQVYAEGMAAGEQARAAKP